MKQKQYNPPKKREKERREETKRERKKKKRGIGAPSHSYFVVPARKHYKTGLLHHISCQDGECGEESEWWGKRGRQEEGKEDKCL